MAVGDDKRGPAPQRVETPPDQGAPALQDDVLSRAAASLREITDDGWVRARPSVLARVLRSARPSTPLRARHGHGTFTVASTVLVDELRRTLDDLPDMRVLDIRCATRADDELEGLTILLSGRFGAYLPDGADEVREIAAATVTSVLGTAFAPRDVVVDLYIADIHLDDGPS